MKNRKKEYIHNKKSKSMPRNKGYDMYIFVRKRRLLLT